MGRGFVQAEQRPAVQSSRMDKTWVLPRKLEVHNRVIGSRYHTRFSAASRLAGIGSEIVQRKKSIPVFGRVSMEMVDRRQAFEIVSDRNFVGHTDTAV